MVKSVDISYTDLTTDQVNTLCRKIIEKKSLVLEDLRITLYPYSVEVEENVKERVKEKVKKVVGL